MQSNLSLLTEAGVQRRQFLGALGFGMISLLFPTRVSAGLLSAGNIVSLRCLAPNLTLRYLEGRHADGGVGLVKQLSVKKDSGTRWQVVRRGEHLIALKCLGVATVPRWLEGKPNASAIALTAPVKQPPDSTAWRIVPADTKNDDIIALECFVAKNGARWLEARGSDGSVGLAAGASAPPGAKWEGKMHPVLIDGGTRLKPADR